MNEARESRSSAIERTPRRNCLCVIQSVVGYRWSVFVTQADGPLGFSRQLLVKRAERHDDLACERALATEARSLTRVAGEHVPQLVDFFCDHRGRATLVLEYLPGLTLRQLIERSAQRGHRIPLAVCSYVAERLFLALARAHEARDPVTGELATVVHGAVSLDTVLVGYDGRVSLFDFTQARLVGDDEEDPRALSPTDDTRAGLRLLISLLAMAEGGSAEASPFADLLARGLHEDSGASLGAAFLARAVVTVPCGRSALRSFMQTLRDASPSDQTRIIPPRTVEAHSAPTPQAFSAAAGSAALPNGATRRKWRTRIGRVAIATVAFAVSLAIVTIGARRLYFQGSSTPEREHRLSATSRVVAPATLGELGLTVDGKQLGNVSTVSAIPCGDHVVQIGSTGRRLQVSAPCGGETRLGL